MEDTSITLSFNIWVLYFVICAFQGFFLIVVINLKKQGSISSRIVLTTLLFVISTILVEYIVQMTGLYMSYPHVIRISGSMWYLLGPLVYLYIKTLVHEDDVWSWKTVLHLTPFIIIFAQSIPYLSRPAAEKLEIYLRFKDAIPSSSPQAMFYTVGYFLQLLVYLFLNAYKLRNYTVKYKQKVANSQIIYVSWFKKVFVAFAIYQVVELSTVIYFRYNQIRIMEFEYGTVSLLSTFILVVAYTAFMQSSNLFPTLIPIKVEAKEHSLLSQSEIDGHLERLKELVINEKPYKDSELKLSDLAKMLSIQPHILSLVINQGLELNFYDFINFYRVEDVKKKLLDSSLQHLSILGIAYEVGFNSKASFYRIFKKATGQTPSEYIKQNQSVTA